MVVFFFQNLEFIEQFFLFGSSALLLVLVTYQKDITGKFILFTVRGALFLLCLFSKNLIITRRFRAPELLAPAVGLLGTLWVPKNFWQKFFLVKFFFGKFFLVK